MYIKKYIQYFFIICQFFNTIITQNVVSNPKIKSQRVHKVKHMDLIDDPTVMDQWQKKFHRTKMKSMVEKLRLRSQYSSIRKICKTYIMDFFKIIFLYQHYHTHVFVHWKKSSPYGITTKLIILKYIDISKCFYFLSMKNVLTPYDVRFFVFNTHARILTIQM